MTRSGKIVLFLLAGAGILVALLAALVFLGPRLLNMKTVRDRAMAALERRSGVHLSYARTEVTLFPRPRVVIRGVVLDVPGLAAGTVKTVQTELELIPLLRGNVRNGVLLLEDPDFRVRIPQRGKPRKSVLRGGARREHLFPPRHAAGKGARDGRHGAERAPRTLVWGETDRVPERTERPGRFPTGTDDALRPLHIPVLGKSFDRVEPAPGGASRGGPRGDSGVPGPRFHRPAGTGRRPLARRNGRFPPRHDRNGRAPEAQARATLSGSKIAFPGIGLALADVGGEASFSDGMITGRGLSAGIGNSRVREGTLRMGISGRDAPFHADALVNADLAEVQPPSPPPGPGRAVPRGDRPDPRSARRRVRTPDPRGTSLFDPPHGGPHSVDLAGTYDRIPFPITIHGGHVSYDGASFAVKDLRGSVGRSTVSGLAGRLNLGKSSAISIRGGTARIALGGVVPLDRLARRDPGNGEAGRRVRGVAEIATLSCEGPLREPGEWRFEASGSMGNLEVDTPLLPGPVTIPRGRFRIRPEELSITDVEASLLDTTFQGGVQLRGYRTGVDQVAASLHGNVGVEAANWAYARIEVPHPYAPRAPFTVTGSTISWEKGGAVVVGATLASPGGPDISLSLRKTPASLSIDPLVIKDNASDAKGTFHLDPGTANVTYAGTLSRSTVEKVVPIPVWPGQRIQGEMELILDRGNFMRVLGPGDARGGRYRHPPGSRSHPSQSRHISLFRGREGGSAWHPSDRLWTTSRSRYRDGGFDGDTVVADPRHLCGGHRRQQTGAEHPAGFLRETGSRRARDGRTPGGWDGEIP